MPKADATQPTMLERLGLTPRRLVVLVLAYLLVLALVAVEVHVARRAILIEVRNAARDLAALLSYEVSTDAINRIYLPDDVDRPEYQQSLAFFRKVRATYKDVRTIYIIRPVPDFESDLWQYVINEQDEDRDVNQDGLIEEAERGMRPSELYALNPGVVDSLRAAEHGPVSTQGFYTDARGRFLSGFAPVINPLSYRPMAVVGIDISEAAVLRKYQMISLVSALSLTLLLGIVTLLFTAYYSKARSLAMIRRLSDRVSEQNEALQRTIDQLGETVTELREREAVMSEGISLAQQIQQRFLPESYPLSGRLRFASHYHPCSKIGGDLYDAFFIDERTAGFFMADVSGHGVSAALLTAALKVAIDRYRLAIGPQIRAARAQANGAGHARREQALAGLLHDLNTAMGQIALPSQFVTILVGVIDIETGEVQLGNAGHNPPLLWRAATQRVETPPLPSNLAIGLLEEFKFQIVTLQTEPGDKLVIYTDGIFERRNAQQEEFGLERLTAAAQASAGQGAEAMLGSIRQELLRFASGCEAHDDQAILIVEFLPR